MNGRNEWSTVLNMEVTTDGAVRRMAFDQCPRCSALVWSENRGHHDDSHKWWRFGR